MMREVDRQVYVTYERKFKKLTGNRQINKLYLAKLRKSIEKELLITIIVVNEKMEIIDGQHRYEVLCELPHLPIRYIICEGYGLKEVQEFNSDSHSWKLVDFLDGYADAGDKNYKILRDFIESSGLQVRLALELINQDDPIESLKDDFKKGYYKIGNLDRACDIVEALESFREFESYRTSNFVKAFARIYTAPGYKHGNMEKKLEYQSIEKSPSIHEYINQLVYIYNNRVTRKDKKLWYVGREFVTPR